jgi:hypothetical protein
LVEELAEMMDRPWPEFGKSGKPITQARLANLLKRPGIGIHPGQVRLGDESRKGYIRHQFDDVFSRFIPEKGPPDRNNETNAYTTGTSTTFQTETFDPFVSVRKSKKPNNDGPCFGVSVWKGGMGQREKFPAREGGEEPQEGVVGSSAGDGDGEEPSPPTRWPGLSPKAVDQLARELSGLKSSTVELDAAVRARLAGSGVPAEALNAEVEKVARHIGDLAAAGGTVVNSPAQAVPGKASNPEFEVLGSAPGERCALCGKGSGVKQIKHGGEVSLWHEDCGCRHLAAMADPPFKLPDLGPEPLDEHGEPRSGKRTGLSPYAVLDWARWYEAEANRRRLGPGLDQSALDRDLRQRLADYGVSPEFIAAEFERVMQAVLAF